jgi:carboxyl-terminal processing protease
MPMKKALRHGLAVLTLLVPVLAASAQQQQLAAVDQLKTEAFKALKGGEFDRTSELISKAASMSQDPALVKMSEWVQRFQTERQEFVTERNKGYEKLVADIKKLQEKGYDEAAIDRMREAHLASSNKDAFMKEQWVVDLLAKAKRLGSDFEGSEKWIKAQRMYSDLASLEATNPLWKDKFKAVTGRLRLLAMYTPDEFKKAAEEEYKSREAIEQTINPTTQPATKPSLDDNDSFKTDWHDLLRGVRMDMLTGALDEARTSYWKDVTYTKLTDGGLNGLKLLATTRGLEKAFPNLADRAKREKFLAAIKQGTDLSDKSTGNDEGRTMRRIIDMILTVNESSIQLPEEVITNEFADGAFATLDPFSTMIWPQDMEEFSKSVQGEFTGVGISIMLDDDGNLKVVTPLEDTPADRAGIRPGDIITRINGRNAKGISLNQAVKNITGPKDSTVVLTVKNPDNVVKDFTIRREVIHVASVKGYQQLPGGGWEYFVDSDQKIAYMRLTSFTKTTEEEMEKAIAEMQRGGAKGIIIDLRNNPGGLLPAATDVCDKFLSQGTIVSTRADREQPGQMPSEAKASASADDVKLPLVVLVNQYSASASEIVSGALQDQHRALVVGDRTFGKGSVQMLFPIPGRAAALKLTTSHYYLPSGRCLHKDDDSVVWGVDPDLKVEMTNDQMRAAMEARQEKEVLHHVGDRPTTGPSEKKDLLAVDPQLSAAVLLLKLELAGATM